MNRKLQKLSETVKSNGSITVGKRNGGLHSHLPHTGTDTVFSTAGGIEGNGTLLVNQCEQHPRIYWMVLTTNMNLIKIPPS